MRILWWRTSLRMETTNIHGERRAMQHFAIQQLPEFSRMLYMQPALLFGSCYLTEHPAWALKPSFRGPI